MKGDGILIKGKRRIARVAVHIKHADAECLIHAGTIQTGSCRSNNNNGNTITRGEPVELDPPDALYMHAPTIYV